MPGFLLACIIGLMFVEPDYTTQLAASHFPQVGLRQLQETGLIALLPGKIPLQEMAPLIDALLAAPVLVAAVQYTEVVSCELLSELRQQAGRLMLVGAVIGYGLESTAWQVALAHLAHAGAQFIVLPLEQAPLCFPHKLPHIPFVRDIAEAATAVRLGYQLLFAALTPEQLAEWRLHLPTANIIAAHDVTAEQIPLYMQQRATAVAVPLWAGVSQTMRELISNARQLSAAWRKYYPSQI